MDTCPRYCMEGLQRAASVETQASAHMCVCVVFWTEQSSTRVDTR